MITTNRSSGRVHRMHAADLVVTELRTTGTDTFEAKVRLPSAHRFYRPVGKRHDPLLVLESVREAGLLVAQTAYGVPKDHTFMVHNLVIKVDPAGLKTRGTKPVDIVVNITADEIRRRRKNFAGMRFEFECVRDGQQFGHGAYRWSCFSPDSYAKVRGAYSSAEPAGSDESVPVRPDSVGRTEEVDVTLADTPDGAEWRLRVDPAHPELFDRPHDHVPGNGVIEAIRQAALLAAGQPDALPVGMDIAFHHYVEFDSPAVVHAERNDETVTVRVSQSGRTAAVADVELNTPE